MPARRSLTALALALALLTAACGSGSSKKTGSSGSTKKPTFAAGTTMAALQQKGKITVGVKFDQPGFGQVDPTKGKPEGFDIEVAKLLAAGIFGGTADSAAAKIDFVEAVSKNREPFIQEGKVDLVVATYTINDARKQVVAFAGPYFVAKQDIMVKADDTSIQSVQDLGGKKVCTVKGSTSEKNLRAKAPTAEVSLFDTYSQCAEALTDGRVVAETTDNTILAGLVKNSAGKFKLLKNPFSDEPYGVGLKKGDDAFRNFLNDELQKMFTDGKWAAAFTATLGKIGLETPQPPTIDRYTS